MKALRVLATILAGPCLVIGAIWVLQGINVLPGSFMTGQMKWAIYGAVLLCVGIGLLVMAKRRQVKTP